MSDTPSINISNDEGWSGSWLLGAAILGFLAGGFLVWSWTKTPADLEATRSVYEQRIREAEREKDTALREAERFNTIAERHRNRVADLEDQISDLELQFTEKPQILKTIEPLPESIEEQTPPEANKQILDLRGSLSSLQKYTNNLEKLLELERERSEELSGALEAMQNAYKEASASLAAETRKAELAEDRVNDWERVSIPRKKAWLIAGSAVVATIFVSRFVK